MGNQLFRVGIFNAKTVTLLCAKRVGAAIIDWITPISMIKTGVQKDDKSSELINVSGGISFNGITKIR